MLEEASFIVLSSSRIPAPFGSCCDVYKGRNGAPLSDYKSFSISNYVGTLNTITLAATREGGVLELADGEDSTNLSRVTRLLWLHLSSRTWSSIVTIVVG